MQWSTAIREAREAIDAAREAALTSAGHLDDLVKAKLAEARDRLERMLDALDNDPDDITDPPA